VRHLLLFEFRAYILSQKVAKKEDTIHTQKREVFEASKCHSVAINQDFIADHCTHLIRRRNRKKDDKEFKAREGFLHPPARLVLTTAALLHMTCCLHMVRRKPQTNLTGTYWVAPRKQKDIK
jgi:hypothetical protein